MKILLAVDGSKHTTRTLARLIEHADWFREKPQVELVTVHLPVPKLPGLGSMVGRTGVTRYYQEEGEARLAEAKKKLAAARISYRPHILVGDPAAAIVQHAGDARCDIIYIGSHGMSDLGKAVLGSTASKVLHSATIPILLVR